MNGADHAGILTRCHPGPSARFGMDQAASRGGGTGGR